MAGEPKLCIPLDPQHAFTGISIAPSIIRASPNVQLPSDPNDLDSLHHFMKSPESSSPERALDEINAIFNKGKELVNLKFGEFLVAFGVDKDDVALEGKEQPRQRREGLGCKRARFSLKPVTSHACDDLGSTFNIDQLQDPAQFFSAFERLENARKEIQMLKGGTAPHSTNYDPSNRHRRRPGILGKSASFKHQYSSAIPEQDDLHMSSPELPGSHDELLQGTNTPDPEKEEIHVEESIVETENNAILDELLSQPNDLDGDSGLSLIQELLQFKPIDVGSLSVPDFHDVGRTNFEAFTEKGPRTRKALSNITNLLNNLTGETPKKLKQGTESPLNSIASPTPPRTPLASSSLLERHSLQKSTQRDPSSPLHVDLSEQINSYSGVDIEEESRQVSALNEPNMPVSLSANMEDDTFRPQLSDIDIYRARHASSTDSALDKNIDRQVMDADASPQRSQNDMLEQRAGMNLHGKAMACDLSGGNEDDTEKNNSDKLTDVGDALKVSLVEVLPNNEDIAKSASSSDMHQCSQVQGKLEEIVSKECYPAHQAAKVQESGMNASDKSQNLTNEVIEVSVEGNHMDMLSTINGERHLQVDLTVSVEGNHMDMLSTINGEQHLQKQNGKTKRSRGTQRKSNAHLLCPSVAAAGTSFESGMRRSTRIKTRPLEYWKGERLLYGRVNECLKLVGLKYISPAKGGGKLKVKSYVSDEYKCDS